ncbi:HAD-IA family hydrolase [Xenorhabdus bovienii]|uniref:HAD-IA family hydrolase n=2 Tax=Xenorhabdus bovienii TaxID=40576 RepID=A0AAJ1JBI7_XENBV|nr:HAD-IA family hydrolase [Xenorhabdus bovienii]MDE1479707.1 HAD-IA family hydrolase [Xenorhabdus bovienii]MDE1485477.1 HAD-IA family hydrolase [Xenorhabdus bovienii]MDE1493823.1 HAD-IA family hydrolase [Xenorhabdus bovienii]MDE9471617.1 HAD-IA family hydrolase [Xenorhabdus bovienii]
MKSGGVMEIFNIKAILFDMDGTLVQSLSEVEVVWSKWCEMHNISIKDVLDICHGVRSKDVILSIAPYLNVEEQIKLLDDLEIKYSATAKALPGVKEFLLSLGTCPWSVVTSASQRVAYHRMAICGLKIPDFIIGSDDVLNGKPYPDPYLMAAERLNIAAEDCLVFEDAYAGVQSALAAGCKVIQIGGKEKMFDSVIGLINDWNEIKITEMGIHSFRVNINL